MTGWKVETINRALGETLTQRSLDSNASSLSWNFTSPLADIKVGSPSAGGKLGIYFYGPTGGALDATSSTNPTIRVEIVESGTITKIPGENKFSRTTKFRITNNSANAIVLDHWSLFGYLPSDTNSSTLFYTSDTLLVEDENGNKVAVTLQSRDVLDLTFTRTIDYSNFISS